MADVNPKVPLIQFPFSAGIDESTRAEVLDAGNAWLVLENGRQNQRGGYSTRKGFTALPILRADATSSSAGYKLLTDGDATLRITDINEVEAYSAATATWKAAGRISEADFTLSDVPVAGTAGTVEDVEYCNGFLAVASRETKTSATAYAYVTIFDAASKAVIYPCASLGVGDVPTLLASFSQRYIVCVTGNNSSTVRAYIYDTNNPATGWAVLATVAVNYTGPAPVDIVGMEDRVAIAYGNNGGGTTRVSVKSYDASGLIDSVTLTTANSTVSAVAIAGSLADTCWVGWADGGGVKLEGLDGSNLASSIAAQATIIAPPAVVGNVGIAPSTGGAGRIYSTSGAALFPRTSMQNFSTVGAATTAVGSTVLMFNAVPISKPTYYGGRYYALFYGGGSATANLGSVSTSWIPNNDQKCVALCDWTDDLTWIRPVALIAPGLATGTYQAKPKIGPGAASTTFYSVTGVTKSGTVDAATLITFDFASSRRWQSAAHGNTTILSGGLVSSFDGQRVAELGFVYRPRQPETSVAGTGITGTNYRYVCVYEELDADGNWCQSGLSLPSATVSPANQTVTVATRPLTITSRMGTVGYTNPPNSLRIAVYRTLTGGTAPYYRVGTMANDPTTILNGFSDNFADATIALNAKLYSQPGISGTAQDKRPPPGFAHLVSYNGMLVGASGSDLHYSGQNVYGEATWFNPVFQSPVPGEGNITALWVMDGTLFVSKRREIYAVAGEAPADNGSSGGLGAPRKLAVNVGASSHVTCVTAYGVFFQSDRGIELFSRNQSVEYIGEGVQVTASDYATLTAATVDPASSCVLLEMHNGTNGRTLVFDLTLKTWVSADRRASHISTVDALAMSACMVRIGTRWRYAWLAADGAVHHENDQHLDADGSFVVKRAVCADVKMGGMQGLQHVNRTLLLAKYHTAHDLAFSFAHNYSTTYGTPRTYTAAELAALVVLIPNMQLEHVMGDEARCESIRAQIQDVTPSSGALGTGQGSTWIALCFEVVPVTGAYQLPDESR